MSMIEKISKNLLIIIGCFCFLIPTANAQNFTVRPFLWDVTVAPRDILSQDITINNQSERLLRLYATVNEITVDAEGEIKEFVAPIETDRTKNITSWLEITRGRITVEPGETVTVPLGLQINPMAEPGEYHAYIGFYDTSKRFEAEAAALRGATIGFPIKVTLSDTSNPDVYVSALSIPRFVLNHDEVRLNIEYTNNGDTNESPTGEVIFYSNRGQEIAATKINDENFTIPASSKKTQEIEVSLPEKVGRYSVSLSGQYGSVDKKSLVATTSFYVLPLWFIVALLVVISLIALLLTFLIRRHNEEGEFGGMHDEIDLPLHIRTGYSSKDTDHDIKINTKK